MTHALQWLRSLVFVVQIYAMMGVLGILFLPWALFSRRGARAACKAWCVWVRWTARWMVGLRTEVRGTPPTDEVLIAAKHQSFLDIILIFGSVPAGKFIMKRELMYAPVIGQYALRIGCVPVDRGKRSQAIKKMVKDVARGAQAPGQLIIYSQGTRIAPGVKAPYKVGSSVLYQELGQDCVPVATNVGVFWPRKGIMRKPGLAVVEFLPRIPAGLDKAGFMKQLETEVESASDALMTEAGFVLEQEEEARGLD
ncbi:1-acyl-sn-glycerol-3-phosphate acyltransferase [Roseovarius spongiae]|uniref:1-acyl-sn-glycerol-3-phosphate acyltransferase n=1 Tax=Roseovarius spongiae TaxID=2320272 RepID=A0A3A8AXE6_9RHOB|nr:lysophospholipid acyltransferase family protein [Roseovarius spongiae]RKF16029.1 1-acyl-sn-glycerol-3-phosphate acyltransferase [Roseovarius spongiae]